MTTPIFIITCDRLSSTKSVVQSYKNCIKTPYELVFVDLGSTYESMVEYLGKMAHRGMKVYMGKSITQVNHLNKVSDYIDDYFQSHDQCDYVVTDCDIALDKTPGDVLRVYSHFLEILPTINVAGPMLRIDDIPDHYPYKKQLLDGTMGQHKRFHSMPVKEIEHFGKKIRYIHSQIDTTFGMYRAKSKWARMSSGIRVLAPYAARHLDWYIDPAKMLPDQTHYMKHASKQIAHWGLVNDDT